MNRPRLWESRYNPESSTVEQMQALLLTLDSDELIAYLEEAKNRLEQDEDVDLAGLSLGVLAPVAGRLNRQGLKHALEDRGFAVSHPQEYHLTKKLLQQHQADRKQSVMRLCDNLRQILRDGHIEDFEIDGRTKQPYSLYKKLHKTGTIGDIHDLLAVRILVADISACYRVLDVIHEFYEPVLQRLKDYIEQPKANGYRSLHTTIRQGRKTIEVQIRTYEMHDQAESGEAAHWHYDQHKDSKQYRRGQAATTFKNLKSSMVYVFSPAGDVYELTHGSTPIDFAFAIHTQVGLRVRGAKINGSIAKLNTQLQNGDLVEIDTAQEPSPKRDWLRMVATRKARNRITSWLRELESERYTELGKSILLDTFGDRLAEDIDEIVDHFGFEDRDKFYKAVGSNAVNTDAIRHYIRLRDEDTHTPHKQTTDSDESVGRATVVISGMSGLQYKLAGCCSPKPKQPIVGFITRSLGITVHRQDCSSAQAESERLIEAEWRG